jgi:hypothetical protein
MKNEAPGFLSKNIEMIAHHDLEGRPGFKMAVQEVDDSAAFCKDAGNEAI